MKIRQIVVVFLTCSFCFALGVFSKTENPITRDLISAAEKLIGIEFNNTERDMMRDDVYEHSKNYQGLRSVEVRNSVPPSLIFQPLPVGLAIPTNKDVFRLSPAAKITRPANLEELAFASIGELSELVRTRAVSSQELTLLFLNRLKKYGPKLECIVSLTEEVALNDAKRADAEIAAGQYKGPLHGIPYGAKDLLSTKGIKTTWGSAIYKDVVPDADAAVITRLRKAGAVLVAKLTLGELAWGDVWYGGKTRNPWNYEQGSSGSSAGSASATAAGLVPFAIGSETWGSIVSPSTRCGITGLRPSFGRVSRSGAMALSWSMDKLGPICRTAEDCAIIFQAIQGPDPEDQSVIDAPFNYTPDLELSKLRIGYLQSDFESKEQVEEDEEEARNAREVRKKNDEQSIAKLTEMGANLIPFQLPALPVNDLAIILEAEAAAAFDDITRSGKDDLMKRQEENAWPNVFRASRFIPAVEYIQANRIRYILIQEMQKKLESFDLYIAPSVDGNNLLLTNLTGHPCVVVPNGFSPAGTPTSITFCGKLYDEGTMLSAAKQYQDATGFHLKHPALRE